MVETTPHGMEPIDPNYPKGNLFTEVDNNLGDVPVPPEPMTEEEPPQKIDHRGELRLPELVDAGVVFDPDYPKGNLFTRVDEKLMKVPVPPEPKTEEESLQTTNHDKEIRLPELEDAGVIKDPTEEDLPEDPKLEVKPQAKPTIRPDYDFFGRDGGNEDKRYT
jgi:hypothetical protein